MVNLAPILQDRCERCDCGGKNEILRDAVLDAARAFMAANLRADRLAQRVSFDKPGSLHAYLSATDALTDALTDLRSACSAERRNR